MADNTPKECILCGELCRDDGKSEVCEWCNAPSVADGPTGHRFDGALNGEDYCVRMLAEGLECGWPRASHRG